MPYGLRHAVAYSESSCSIRNESAVFSGFTYLRIDPTKPTTDKTEMCVQDLRDDEGFPTSGAEATEATGLLPKAHSKLSRKPDY